mgnify:FL=1
MKKPLNTPIDIDIKDKFKEKCDEHNLKMNIVLEKFMREVISGNILIEHDIKLKNNKSEGE